MRRSAPPRIDDLALEPAGYVQSRRSQTLLGSDSLVFSSSPCERKVWQNVTVLSTECLVVDDSLILGRLFLRARKKRPQA